MKLLISFFIFCIVLFIYLHIQFHLKHSDDLEIYEIDISSKDKFDEICDIRQPLLFDFDNKKIIDTMNKDFIFNNYPAFELKIRNVKDNDKGELYIPLKITDTNKLLNEDKKSLYYSENNEDFLKETGMIKNMRYNDEFLRPHMVSNCNYDILMGSKHCCTPFRYEINYRNYLMVTQGSIKIKMAPPKSTRYLYPIYDYDAFEFKSPLLPWNIQPEYISDFDKIKCLELTLVPGKTLYIPAFWWYSIQFDDNTSVAFFKYKTYMNILAIIPYIIMYSLQILNTKRNIVKTIDFTTLTQAEQSSSSPASPL